MNLDEKVLNTILENIHIIVWKIHHYQFGFKWGITDWFNIRKSIIIFYHTNRLEENISMDIESL